MHTMQQIDKQEYLVSVTILNKLHYYIAAMPIKYKQPPLPSCLCFCLAIKYLLQLFKSYIIVYPATQ